MGRLTERLIDLAALAMLLAFAYAVIDKAPELSGGIAVAACAFWLTKNASPPHAPPPPSIAEATALAAAEVLRVAKEAAELASTPQQVEIVDQPVEVVPTHPSS